MMEPAALLPPGTRALIEEALAALDVRNLVLAIHDASFPSAEGEDIGRGTPYARGGRALLAFARELGFNGVQLGPQGQTSEANPSPYDGTLFSRNVLNLAPTRLVEEGLVAPETLAAMVAGRPDGSGARVHHRYAWAVQHAALAEAWATFRRVRAAARAGRYSPRERAAVLQGAEALEAFAREGADWLVPDALYGVLCREHGQPYWREWRDGEAPSLDQRLFAPRAGEGEACAARLRSLLRHSEEVEAYAFGQYLVHTQHRELRAFTAELGMKLFGDLQVGYSPQDAWAHQALFLGGYLMGAPPSRTNPEGQPWNYPVLDPARYATEEGEPDAVLRFMTARTHKMLAEYDGVRVDHPHGLVDPWVYRSGEPDALRAVQQGARLFSSPDLPDHPGLARFAIAHPEQLNRTRPRHADDWVAHLEDAQVHRYATLLDTVLFAAHAHGRRLTDLLCEVLSTLPYPLARVLAQDGLGRFRVTQKANLADPADVYRSENAEPPDWVMLGNHDTPPIWRVARAWRGSAEGRAQADYLAWRLHPEAQGREALARQLMGHPGLLVQAKLADLFASRAQNVMVFWADLFGEEEVYNTPGTVSPDNWCLRLPGAWRHAYAERLGRDAALNLPRALALALRSRGEDALAARLEALAAAVAGR